MELFFVCLCTGFLGMALGWLMGESTGAIIGSFVGMLFPIAYVLDKIYKNMDYYEENKSENTSDN